MFMDKVKGIVAVLALLGTPAIVFAQANSSSKATENLKPKVACSAMAGRMIPASAIALPTKGAIIKSAKEDPGTGKIAIPADFIPEHCYIEGAIKPVDPATP